MRKIELLRKEHRANAIPLSRPPFPDGSATLKPGEDGEPSKELGLGELRVIAPEEVPWIDLLLEIAMTTAFASLTDGTPILQWNNALSYVCYFVFVWWIWIAQVAYNMRFRQADWLHRIWVFVQLIVFSGLAAFTKDFNITHGLWVNPGETLTDQLLSQSGDASQLAALDLRVERLPRLNDKGLSTVMAASRLVLLLQYAIVFYHARNRKLKLTSLMAHMASLVFSAVCFFVASRILGSTDNWNFVPTHTAEVVKLVLWYLPILIEIATHFIALKLPGFVGYSTELIDKAASTVFLIILGSGLDKITSGFKIIVGNIGVGKEGIPFFISASVAFISFFSLYFWTPGHTTRLVNGRALAWFFSQFFFLAALIVSLEGIGNSLSFTNLNGALTRSDNAMLPLIQWMNNHPGVNLTADDLESYAPLFDKLGFSFEDMLDELNSYVALAKQQNNSDVITTGQLLNRMEMYQFILQIYEAPPPDGSLLSAKLDVFSSAQPGDTTKINIATFEDIHNQILKDRGSFVLWLYPAAGSTILALVLMSFIRGSPRDKWEWAIAVSRYIVGSGICFLALLDIGSTKPIFDSEGHETTSIIWVVARGQAHTLLIILALAMGILQIVENLIAYAADKSYRSLPDIDIFDHEAKTAKYEQISVNAMPSTPYHFTNDNAPDQQPVANSS